MALLGLDTREKKGIFISYMVLFCTLRVVIYGSKHNGAAPDYNQNSLLMFVAVAKLLMAFGMYLQQDGNLMTLSNQIRGSLPLLLKYSIPAICYVIYDTLTFVNLANVDIVTFNILLQLRTPATGLMWQML